MASNYSLSKILYFSMISIGIIFTCFTSSQADSQEPGGSDNEEITDPSWIITIAGTSDSPGDIETVFSVDVDNEGNVYACGYCADNADFDPSSGTNLQEGYSMFLVKYSADGELVWVNTWPFLLFNIYHRINVLVNEDGDVYLAGSFSGNLDFDPGPEIEFRRATGWGDVFLCKFTSSGGLEWVECWGDPGELELGENESNDRFESIYLTNTGDIALVGTYDGDFLATSNTLNESDNSTEIDTLGDIFLKVFDSSGNLKISKTIIAERINWGDYPQRPDIWGFQVDDAGNFYILGATNGDIDFDPGPDEQIAQGGPGGLLHFLLKLNSVGEYEWVEFPPVDVHCQMVMDNIGNIYIACPIRSYVDYPLDFGIKTNEGCMLLMLDSNGEHQWTKFVENPQYTGAWFDTIDIDDEGDIYFSVEPFQIGGETNPPIEPHYTLIKFSHTGELLWELNLGSDFNYGFHDIAFDSFGNFYAVGSFKDTVQFPEEFELEDITPVDDSDAYLLKVSLGLLNRAGLEAD